MGLARHAQDRDGGEVVEDEEGEKAGRERRQKRGGVERCKSNGGEDVFKVDNPGSLSEAIRAPSDWSPGNS